MAKTSVDSTQGVSGIIFAGFSGDSGLVYDSGTPAQKAMAALIRTQWPVLSLQPKTAFRVGSF
jgi:hypothetical protein